VSIILPTYNEEGNIERLINKISKILGNQKYEIVIVDDDSRDKTSEIINKHSKSSKVVGVHRYGKRGIFSAILDGVKACSGEFIMIMDSDFSHPPELIPYLISYSNEYDVVSGSRFLRRSGIEAPFLRKYGTIMLNIFCKIILGLKPKDLTGGFHIIKKDKFNQLNFKYKTIWGEFDMEFFWRASQKKFTIKEVPFIYKFREEGTSKSENLLKYGYIYAKRALQLRFFR
ncbi:glycosyltransferase, partial [Candidatus Woesearchaeota archaeon]|nr:glycosyltransferase [Candidatus Woesearchaeota archaeon]